MASICLYDIDFFHSQNFSPPNLELMKVFNFYYSNNHIVNFGEPNENLERYNQIIFFKANPNIRVPKALSLSGEKRQIYGYGFFNRFIPLKEQFKNLPPSYLPYEINEEKIKKISEYRKIKRNSIIRVENEDFCDFKKESKILYITDYNFLGLDNSFNFLKSYSSKYKIYFFYPLIAKSQEIFEQFFPLIKNSNRRIVVDFNFTEDFFKKYYYENILFSMQRLKEAPNFLLNIIQMILYAKKENQSVCFTSVNFSKQEIKKEPLLKFWKCIVKWSYLKSDISCYDFLKQQSNFQEVENYLYTNSSLRLLLKQAPIKS